MTSELPSWADTPTRAAIVAFVERVATGPDAVPEADRIAVFDNDGTLWSEKPFATQLAYLVGQWRRQAEADPTLAERQPYRAVVSGDLAWIAGAVERHYQGDDTDLTTLIGAVVGTSAGASIEEYAASVEEFFATATHPTLGTPYSQTVYAPMVELLWYLEAHGFTVYLVSGGERDFMRPMTLQNYGVPPERVIGSAFGLSYDPETHEVRYSGGLDFFDDGPEKPVRIWSRIGRRPLFAGGNSNGDQAMLDFTRKGGGFAMLVRHDDDTERGDTPYDRGAEQVLAAASERGYTVVSVKRDWTRVFPEA